MLPHLPLKALICLIHAGAQDGYLIVEDGASISEIALCSSSENTFIAAGAEAIYGEYDHTFSGAGDGAILNGHNVITTLTSSTNSGLLNVVVLSRYTYFASTCSHLF